MAMQQAASQANAQTQKIGTEAANNIQSYSAVATALITDWQARVQESISVHKMKLEEANTELQTTISVFQSSIARAGQFTANAQLSAKEASDAISSYLQLRIPQQQQQQPQQ